jgi:hypothetical protein
MRGLTDDESVTLLERLIGVSRVRPELADVRALVRHTAGLPQVLAAVGMRIAARPNWSIAEARGRLGRPAPSAPVQPPECDAIERPYESAMAQLSPAQARAFRLLAMADGPDISVAAASAVLDLPVADTAALLESLVDVHLLDAAGPDRYRYQEPPRAFARGRAFTDDGPEATQAALTRLVRFYSAEPLRTVS